MPKADETMNATASASNSRTVFVVDARSVMNQFVAHLMDQYTKGFRRREIRTNRNPSTRRGAVGASRNRFIDKRDSPPLDYRFHLDDQLTWLAVRCGEFSEWLAICLADI